MSCAIFSVVEKDPCAPQMPGPGLSHRRFPDKIFELETNMTKLSSAVAPALAFLALNGVAVAEAGDGQRHGGRHGPPAVAMEACAAAVQGDACSFVGREGETVSGSCEIPRDEQLVCSPEGGPPGHGDRGERGERGEQRE